MSKREFGVEYQDIIELLAPLRKLIPGKAAEEKLSGLLAYASKLGPYLTPWGRFWGYLSQMAGRISIKQVIPVGMVVLFAIVAALVIPNAQSGVGFDVTSGPGSEIIPVTGGEPVESTDVIEEQPTQTAPPTPTKGASSNASSEPTAATLVASEVTATTTSGQSGSGGATVTSSGGIQSTVSSESMLTSGNTRTPEETSTPENTPTPEKTPTPENTPIPENTPMSEPPPPTTTSVIVVRINAPSPGDKITGVGRTKFSASAYDQAIGTADGAGISHVAFRLSGPNGVFHTSTDSAVPYCEFGGASPCASMGNGLWKQLVAGSYTLKVTAYSTSGQSASTSVSFIVEVK